MRDRKAGRAVVIPSLAKALTYLIQEEHRRYAKPNTQFVEGIYFAISQGYLLSRIQKLYLEVNPGENIAVADHKIDSFDKLRIGFCVSAMFLLNQVY